MREVCDDLGTPVRLPTSPMRIVSLVPSLTEALAVTVPERLVGATDWCTHPADLRVTRVRGTKNPDRQLIAALKPDLIVANREENRRLDVERLRAAGLNVWVTVIESVADAIASLRRLFSEALSVPEPSWLGAAERVWGASPPLPALSGVVAVWRDPWMVVGSNTFTGDVVRRLGLCNVFADSPDRYPRIELDDLQEADPRIVLLPDEPYAFSASDGPECFPSSAVLLCSGRDLTWYGPSLVEARTRLTRAIRRAAPAARPGLIQGPGNDLRGGRAGRRGDGRARGEAGTSPDR